MYSDIDISALLLIGFPIRKSPDQRLFDAFPKLIAANHVLHRLLSPRHPPYALNNLTKEYFLYSHYEVFKVQIYTNK